MREDWKNAAEEALKSTYETLWRRMFSELVQSRYDHCVWLQAPSGYLLSAADTRIAVDPVLRRTWMHEGLASRAAEDFAGVSHILITHAHNDHMDTKLAAALRDLPLTWILPDFIDPEILCDAGLTPKHIRRIAPGEQFSLGNLGVSSFESLHFNADGTRGVRECGYYIDTGSRRLLFPGDIRNYDLKLRPDPGPVDTLFAHVWFGVENAKNLPCEPVLSDFCDFMCAYRPTKVLLGHLYELGRTSEDMWTYAHAGLAMDGMLARLPELEVAIPRIGERCGLL